jgi:hypothetical protein
MDNSKALVRLTESADLLGMLDDLMSAIGPGQSSPSTMSGVRLTLRNVREAILNSHDTLAADFVNRARGMGHEQSESARSAGPVIARTASIANNIEMTKAAAESARSAPVRKELRSVLDRSPEA